MTTVPPTAAPKQPARRSQAERRAGTRHAIYVAATQCLLESGLAGFKTARVARLAGVSEGSIFRYFPTKADLLAAAMERLFAELREAYEERFAEIDDGHLDGQALTQVLWSLMGDERLLALLELMPKARNDPVLRDALKPVIARHRTTMHSRVRRLFKDQPIAEWPQLGGAVDTLVLAMQGMQFHNLVVRNPAHVKTMLEFIASSMDLAFELFEQAYGQNPALSLEAFGPQSQ